MLEKSSYIIRKETKFFLKDWKSLVLLFITPIVLVLIVGAAFVSSAPKNINIDVCGVEDNDIYQNVVSITRNSGVFLVNSYVLNSTESCRISIRNSIDLSASKAGIVVPTKSATNNLEVIVDNSRIISDYIVSYFRIITSDISDRMTTRYVGLLYENIDYVKTDLMSYENSLIEQRSRIDRVRNGIKNAKNDLQTIKSLIIEAGTTRNFVSELDNSVTSLSASKNNIDNSLSELNQVLQLVSSANISEPTKSSIMSSLQSVYSQLNSTSSAIDNTKKNLASSSDYVRNYKASMGSHAQRIEDVIFQLSSIDNSLYSVAEEMNSIILKTNDLKNKINLIKSPDAPKTTQFVKANFYNYFSSGKLIDFIFPSILVMTLMLVSSFISSMTLMRQRSNGLLERLVIAPSGCGYVVIHKIATNIFLSLVPLPFILIIASTILNLEFFVSNIAITFIVLILSIIIFVSIGFVIATLSNSESTAILLSLIIIVPMMFLSGIFVPVEKFPSIVGAISPYMPLSVVTSTLESSTIYSVVNFTGIITMIFYAFFSVFISYLVLKKSLLKG